MVDFMIVTSKKTKSGTEIYPKFVIGKTSDLMIRGGDFYAVWIDERGLWSTDEEDVIRLVDAEMKEYKRTKEPDGYINYMWDSETGVIDKFHKYCQKQMRDSFHMLDEKLIFSNTETKKQDFASKKLSYPLEKGDISAWDKLIGTLYSEEEREKIEWAIGAVVSGASKTIQKFLVLYGAAGTGKSTVLNIIQQLFEGYYSVFDAKALGSSSNSFALEAFKTNPLVAIQHDGDLSRIEDNTRLNSLVSHELMTVNEKFKSAYSNRFKSFLFMGTNKPVRITDAKSGLIRRLIDVTPSGDKLSPRDYQKTVKQVEFELGAIAYHCKEVYEEDPDKYDRYIPIAMLGASNDFYNYIVEYYYVFKKDNGTTLKAAWEMYKNYCDDAKVSYPYSQRIFKEELKNYFHEFKPRYTEGESRLRNYYQGFRTEKIDGEKMPVEENSKYVIEFLEQPSIFDQEASSYPAQYAKEVDNKVIPTHGWDYVKTTLSEIDTSLLHYVKVPLNHIVIDFDIPNEKGEKSYALNLDAASAWPPTYAELSKSGEGIHLHYIYLGDPNALSRVYSDHVEIKVFVGNASLRRKLTKCNNLPIATISSGLPLKGEKKMINGDTIKSEKGLRSMIERNLNKEIHPDTTSSINFIYKILDDAYTGGLHYDVRDMENAIIAFAAHATNQSAYCLSKVDEMKFHSEEPALDIEEGEHPLAFYDVEVFPNLFLINWKLPGLGKPIIRMINPRPSDVEALIQLRLIGFNNRDYDNHMIYAAMMGYDNLALYWLSQCIIGKEKGAKFGNAYNLSYTDVFDFASAGNKKSLKKLEIEMGSISEEKLQKKGFSEEEIAIIKAGTHHQELGLSWDEPVPEELWEKVAEYCDNDVIATEAAFTYLKGDWIARQILADISGLSVNDTTNTHSTKIIFGNNKHPQSEFNYRNLAMPVSSDRYEEYREKFGPDYQFRVFNEDGLPEYRDYIPGEELPQGWSILPFFPGYTMERGKSVYMGETIGEGGRVYAEPGIWGAVWDGDVTGQHPSTIRAEVLFGPKYTKAYTDIVDGRVSIKHQSWSDLDELFEGKLKPYIQLVIDGKLTKGDLANALKTVVNSVYGLTSASFDNAFKDPRNTDNIVAKRGALFMTLLKSQVQKKGFKVAHIKTDSIKIPDATEEIKDFVCKFGLEYGYSFETEAEFDRFCIVNDAVYVAKDKEGNWTATGTQFQVPYVFKKLFTKEPIVFHDLCETKSVQSAIYLDMNESLPDVTMEEKKLTKIIKTMRDNGIEPDLSGASGDDELDSLIKEISSGHDYRFIGKVGRFCPIKPGCGGGLLMRKQNNKYYAVNGTKGYRWLESEMVQEINYEDNIDLSYYNSLVDAAVHTIAAYGDFEWFVSEDPYIGPEFAFGQPIYEEEELPFN